MERFKYLKKENSSESVLNKYQYEELKNKIIIQSSKYNEVIVFNDIIEFKEFNEKLLEENRIYNEVIFSDDIQKFKIDMDMKDNIFNELNNIIDINELINDCINIIFKIIRCNKFQYYIYDSSDIDKCIISKHIIFDFYVKNVYDAKILYNEMINILSNKYNEKSLSIIDSSVYKNIQNFRLPNHKKYKSNRYKKEEINEKIDITYGMIKNYNNKNIHIIDLKELNIKYNEKTIEYKENELEQEIINEVLIIAKKYIEAFEIREIISNKIIFNRIRESYCEICERIHENENSIYIIVYSNKFRIYCRRNDDKYIECDLKNQDVNIKLNKYLIMKRNLNNIINNKEYKYNKNEDIFDKKNIIKYNNKTIKEYEFKDKKILIIHSNVKTGKTQKLKEYIEKNTNLKYIIIISFRILFSIELNDKLKDFINYLDIKEKRYSLKKIKKIIIQLDSLYKLNIDVDPDIIILDEIESILNQFTSPYIKNLRIIWEIFEYLLKKSKKILCMDANVTQRTINLLINTYNKDEIIYHNNTYSTINNDKYYIMFNFKIFLTKLNKLIEEDNKIVIPINSLKKAKIIYNYIRINYPKKQIKIYSSETDDYIKQKDLKDINKNWCKYDIIIYTPCITAGISFDEIHFNYLFGYFTNQSCDVYTIYQMLYRVRNLKENKIYLMFDILSVNDNIITNKIDLLEEIKYSFKHLYNDAINFKINNHNNEMINIIDEKDLFFNLWIDNKLIKNKSHYYILYEFIEILKYNKCNYEIIYQLDNEIENIIKIDINQINNDILYYENKKILEAPDITADTYIILNNASMLTEEEKIIKKKHFLKILYNNYESLTMEFLKEYNNELRIQQCINLIKVKNFTINIRKIISDILNNNNNDNQCIKYLSIEKHIYLKQIIDIIDLTGLNVYNINNYNILYDDYIKNIEKNNKELINLFKIINIPGKKKITDKDIKNLVNDTWNLGIIKNKLNIGKNNPNYIELKRSIYFNDTDPIKYNDKILEDKY